jgi:hypothetical protein
MKQKGKSGHVIYEKKGNTIIPHSHFIGKKVGGDFFLLLLLLPRHLVIFTFHFFPGKLFCAE